jgi:hypothetical protein
MCGRRATVRRTTRRIVSSPRRYAYLRGRSNQGVDEGALQVDGLRGHELLVPIHALSPSPHNSPLALGAPPATRALRVNRTQARVNHTQALVNHTLARVNHTQALVNHTLARVNRTQARVNRTQARVNRTQARVNRTQARVTVLRRVLTVLRRVLTVLRRAARRTAASASGAGRGRALRATATSVVEALPCGWALEADAPPVVQVHPPLPSARTVC